MASIDWILQHRIIAHLLFWVSFLVLTTILATVNAIPVVYPIVNHLVLLPAQILASYSLVYYQFPQLFLKKKYILFVFSCLISVYIFSVLGRLCTVYIADPITRGNVEQESFSTIISDPLYLFSVYFPGVYVIAFLMLIIKLIKEQFEEKNRLEGLEREKLATELKLLKAQINPHFLFNTLNNLYALTLAKSDAAPLAVIKLSELLDYIIHEGNQAQVPLQKELEMVKNYIDLEKLRYGQRLELIVEEELSVPHLLIAPMILLSIIENAFKHGVNPNPVNAKIHIQLKTNAEQLYFKVFNTKPLHFTIPETEKEGNGIGSTNIKRQLELNYPQKHELNIRNEENTYTLILKIDLN